MAKTGSTKDVHILVQLDRLEDQRPGASGSPKAGGFKKDCIETYSETNTGDLYGTGKGIWRGDGAQDYVNRAREERR